MTQLGNTRASFDLTDFGSVESFERVLRANDLSENTSYDGKGWEWTNDSVAIHTYANPLTGERAGMPERRNEPGYASYIHIQGQPDAVQELYASIQGAAEYMKEACLGEWVV